MAHLTIPVQVTGHLLITDRDSGEVLLDQHNAIHPQNMSRIISRALANEDNSTIYRIAFGNGGTFIDAANNTVYNPPNTGASGEGWESRLYNETYSEIVDESDPNHKTDPGSAGSDNVRVGGGAVPSDDPVGGGVSSLEVGLKSNIIVSMFMNENEPSAQLATQSPIPSLDEDERCFVFDEIGLYSDGKPAVATSGVSDVCLNNKTSEDDTLLSPNTLVSVDVTVDGVSYSCVLLIPASGTGSGGALTYGDLCDGINDGSWIINGDLIYNNLYVFITDMSNGTYATIVNAQSFGNLTFQSKSSGVASSMVLTCDDMDGTNLFNILTSGICANVNVNQVQGENAGVQNDANSPENERERLLTHIIFDPILKSFDRTINITYTLTVSTSDTSDSITAIT